MYRKNHNTLAIISVIQMYLAKTSLLGVEIIKVKVIQHISMHFEVVENTRLGLTKLGVLACFSQHKSVSINIIQHELIMDQNFISQQAQHSACIVNIQPTNHQSRVNLNKSMLAIIANSLDELDQAILSRGQNKKKKRNNAHN